MAEIRIAPLQYVMGVAPSISNIFGETGNKGIVEKINSNWSGISGVIFGKPEDPRASCYNYFMQTVHIPLTVSGEMLNKTLNMVTNQDEIRPIISIEDLQFIPTPMEFPILTMPLVNELFKEERIYGFGRKLSEIPDEDPFARLLNNNTVILNPTDGSQPEVITYDWCSLDPDMTEEEVDTIDLTREWIGNFLTDQLGKGGDMIDPTSYPDHIKPKSLTKKS